MQYTLTNQVKLIAVRLGSAAVPTVLTAHTYGTWSAGEFSSRCRSLATSLPTTLSKMRLLDEGTQFGGPPTQITERRKHIKELNDRVAQLDTPRVGEGRKSVLDSYLEATIVRRIASITPEWDPNYEEFVTIGHWEMRWFEEFNSPSYSWEPYFSDLGRSLANAVTVPLRRPFIP